MTHPAINRGRRGNLKDTIKMDRPPPIKTYERDILRSPET